MFFYLGSPRPHWLAETDVPLFVSHQSLGPRESFPRALGPWALDSGAFTQIGNYGRFLTTARQYATSVRRIAREVGKMQWAAPQDWMCEPQVLQKTGLRVREHQKRTVESLITLRSIAPEVPWCPILQGWTLDDYLWCRDHYMSRGIDLTCEPIVGIGSVCRRQATSEIATIVTRVAKEKIRLHGFGVKLGGLERYGKALVSSDSMAWSKKARYYTQKTGRPSIRGHDKPGPGRREGHASCSSCLEFALQSYEELFDAGLIDDRLPSMRRPEGCGRPRRVVRVHAAPREERAPARPQKSQQRRDMTRGRRELPPWQAALIIED